MIRKRHGTVLKDIQTLFEAGAVGTWSDAELLGRFAGRRDASADTAFAALVERHGPMVLRVCRSVLRDHHDAQDAFQATFLILVRRASAVRNRESVGSWLYGVALRVSVRARAAIARRRRHETRAAEMAAARSSQEHTSPELSAILHQELARLPERYRAAVVLCYLEGQTCEAAARQLGWPVGTVKSRLARGRARLFARLIRRGLEPDESSTRGSSSAMLSAALANQTTQAMLRFAAGKPTAGLASPTALHWALTTSRTIQLTRFAMISALLTAGLATTAAALVAIHEPTPTASAAPPKTAAQKPAPAAPPTKVELISVCVVDLEGRGMSNIEVELVDLCFTSEVRRYRSGADGRFRFPADPHCGHSELHARPDDRTFGWARITDRRLWPSSDEHPITLVLLPLNHHVEGSVVDSRGKPIPGVQVSPYQIEHEDTNGYCTEPSLGAAVTDPAGRFAIDLPLNTRVSTFRAYHPRYVGPHFGCGAVDRTIPPVTLFDAGGIAGTVIDATTGKPVAGARVGAQTIELGSRAVLGGGGGHTTSDANGLFQIGGLEPGVYNLLFDASPRGRRFTARAVEGVRVKAGEDAHADLLMVEGRRLHGTAIYRIDNTPMIGTNVMCYNSSHPRSGAACQGTYTDDQGRFEFFVPPGPAMVYIPADKKIVSVPADRDPEPISLEVNPNGPPRPDMWAKNVDVGECTARVRVHLGADSTRRDDDPRSLSGRIFDPAGRPVAGVRVYYNDTTLVVAATDRMGVFRMKGLPKGSLQLCMDKDDHATGLATIPADAAEVELMLPRHPNAPQ